MPLLLSLMLSWSLTAAASGPEVRTFEFIYELPATHFPETGVVDVYLPLPVENEDQKVLDSDIRSSFPGKIGVEGIHGNRYLHIRRPANVKDPVHAEMTWTIERKVVRPGKGGLDEEERALYLAPNTLVPVDHEILYPILDEIREARTDDSQEATARAIYDWLVDNVEYKKVGTGWGNGDTFWACSERYGNCTDFHALFISLARSEGIPARFEIGFPVPLERTEGAIGGYHCWVEFYLPERGWVPIDASEAAKHPEKRELYFGTHPADRIHFSTGRDLNLTGGKNRQVLNYFIYPHVEIDDAPLGRSVAGRFRYREL